MWHSLLLGKWKELFFWLPIEELIQFRQKEVTVVGRFTDQDKTPVDRLLSILGNDILSAAEIMERLGLSHRPTFRKNYLNPALEQKLIERTIPDRPNSKNQKYRKRK